MLNKIIKEDILKLKKPFSMSLEINNICNAKCTFCGYGKDGSDPREKGSLDQKVFEHAIDLYEKSGGQIVDITPTLGEVTVDKRWLELIKKVKTETNISTVRSYSNAINLHKFGSDDILLSGLDILQLSSSIVNQEMYKRLYGVDKFDQVCENILTLCKRNYELGFPIDINLNLRIDLPKENFFKTEFYKEISKYLVNKKITFLEQYDDFNGIVKGQDIPKNSSFVNNKHLNSISGIPCYQLYRVLQVNYDGVIQGCACRVESELWTENILDHDNIESAWRNSKLDIIRNDWLSGKKIPQCCTTCTHYAPYTNLVKYTTPNKRFKEYLIKIIKRIGLYKYIQYFNLYQQKIQRK